MTNAPLHPATGCIWYGEETYLMQGATQVPVVHSVAYGYDDLDEWLAQPEQQHITLDADQRRVVDLVCRQKRNVCAAPHAPRMQYTSHTYDPRPGISRLYRVSAKTPPPAKLHGCIGGLKCEGGYKNVFS